MILNLVVTAAVTALVIAAAFGISLWRGRYDTIDTVWGLGFVVIAAVTFALSSGDGSLAFRVTATALTAVWGLRLAIHLHLRNHGKPEDRRYAEILAKAKANPKAHMFRVVFLTQGAVMWIVSLPVQVAQYGQHTFGPLAYLGVALWLVGFTFEAVGDRQLSRFTADPANKGRVLDTGLWRYTRHPNYFGDAWRMVGSVPDRLPLVGRRGHAPRAAAHDVPARQRHRQTPDRETPGKHPARLRRLRRTHQRIPSAATQENTEESI